MHELTHIPAKYWCQQCVRGKAAMAPHRVALPQDKDKGPPVVAIDLTYLKTDCTVSDDKECIWATTLAIVDKGINYPTAVAVESKGSDNSDYMAKSIITLMKQLCHRKVALRHDGEPAMINLAQKVQINGKIHGLDAPLQQVPPTRATGQLRSATTWRRDT
jgi:hypothetical protein